MLVPLVDRERSHKQLGLIDGHGYVLALTILVSVHLAEREGIQRIWTCEKTCREP